MIDLGLEPRLIVLLLVSAGTAIVAGRLNIPYIVALVVAGVLVGLAPVARVELDRNLILHGLLPPLLFDAALNIDLGELRQRAAQVAVLAVPGTVLTAIIAAAALRIAVGMDPRFALLAGVMLAATDPVSVLATLKEHRVVSGLRTLVGGESIFNDALGVVLVTTVLAFVFPDAGGWRLADALARFAEDIAVGSSVGLIAGFIAHRLMRVVDDHFVEITVSIAVAFAASLLADRLGGSGIIATVVAGLFLSNYRPTAAQSETAREHLLLFWEVLAFLMNSMIFLLMGMQQGVQTAIADRRSVVAILAATCGLLVGRALVTYLLLRPFRGPSPRQIPAAWFPVVFWGGLRGAIPVALVLGLTPAQRQFGAVDATGLVFGVVLLSVVGQGLSFGPLLARQGLAGDSSRSEL